MKALKSDGSPKLQKSKESISEMKINLNYEASSDEEAMPLMLKKTKKELKQERNWMIFVLWAMVLNNFNEL